MRASDAANAPSAMKEQSLICKLHHLAWRHIEEAPAGNPALALVPARAGLMPRGGHILFGPWPVTMRVGGTEDADEWCAACRCNVHRPRVSRDHQRSRFDQ